MNSERKKVSVYLFLTLVFTSFSFFPRSHLESFNSLAARAESLDIMWRVMANYIPILLVFLIYLTIQRKNLLVVMDIKKTKTRMVLIFLIIAILVPAIRFSEKQFDFFKSMYAIIGIGHIGSGFADLAGVLEGAVKVANPGEYFKIDCPGTCVEYRWQYSRYLLDYPFETLLSKSTQVVGTLSLIAMIASIAFVFRKLFLTPLTLLFLLIPANLLAYERMNIENAIFLIIPVLAFLSEARFRHIYVPILIIVLTVIKFYPLALVGLFVMLNRRNLKVVGIYLLTLLAGYLITFEDIRNIGGPNMIAGFAGSIGFPNFLSLIAGNSNPYFHQVPILWIFLGFVFCLIFTKLGFMVNIGRTDLTAIDIKLFFIASTLILSAWATNSNYMYRFVIFTWCIPFLVKIYPINRQLVSLTCAMIFVGMSIIPVSMSPVRNVLMAGGLSLLLGIFGKYLINDQEAKGSPVFNQ